MSDMLDHEATIVQPGQFIEIGHLFDTLLVGLLLGEIFDAAHIVHDTQPIPHLADAKADR